MSQFADALELPTSLPVVPSIISASAYVVVLLFALWRLWTASGGGSTIPWSYLALTVHDSTRIAVFTIQAYQGWQKSTGEQINPTLYEAAQAVFGVGHVVLVWAGSYVLLKHSEPKGRWTRLLQQAPWLLLISVVLEVLCGLDAYKALTDVSVSLKIELETTLSAVVELAVIASSSIPVILERIGGQSEGGAVFKSGHVLAIVPVGTLIAHVAYRVVRFAMKNADGLSKVASAAADLEFWVLEAAMDFVIVVILLLFPAHGTTQGPGLDARQDAEIRQPPLPEDDTETQDMNEDVHGDNLAVQTRLRSRIAIVSIFALVGIIGLASSFFE